VPQFGDNIRDGEIHMADLVDIAIPANAQAAAEALGLTVHRSVTSGAWVRQVPRDEAEIAVECLRDAGFCVRILDSAAPDQRPPERAVAQSVVRICRVTLKQPST
jgi:hydrogenase maturation factor